MINGWNPFILEDDKSKNAELLTNLQNHIIPDTYKGVVGIKNLVLMKQIIALQGFPLLAKDWLVPLAKWIGSRKCVELMAGCGSLSYVLSQEGVDITPTDNGSWDYR